VAPSEWKTLWRQRRLNNNELDQSGVWRYREALPFLQDYSNVVTLREGNTPLLPAPKAAEYGGLDALTFKHQGFNPTGSFKDNGMTCGVSQARSLGKHRVGCVSTGNTSASMAAYASKAGLNPIIFLPHGNISFGKLSQALEYGATTLQIQANFDQILALVRRVADKGDMYLLNSINPFRIEGQKAIAIELLDQLDWMVPDWVVMPGGNLGNCSALGKGFIEMLQLGLIDRLPRIAVVQAEGAAPFYQFMKAPAEDNFAPVESPDTLATAIRIGDPVSWPKAWSVLKKTNGVVEKVSEQEIADAKAIIGRSGIGCEPASAATLAGIKKLIDRKVISADANVVAILTGNLLKDPDYIYRYHTGQLKTGHGDVIASTFGNSPKVVENSDQAILDLLASM
jgi:threonine synthase